MLTPIFFPRAVKALVTNPRLRPFDLVGYTPEFLNADDPDDAVSQLHKHYGHGGGWHDFNGFTLVDNKGNPELHAPGDPPTEAVAEWKLRDERIILFDHAWVAVVQPSGDMRVARMD